MLTEKDMAELTERMGEHVHIAWMDKRAKEKGWHNPLDCPERSDEEKAQINHAISYGGPSTKEIAERWLRLKGCPNCHPCMVSYKDLPDSEKELDRAYPKTFFKILEDMGFIVVEKKQYDNMVVCQHCIDDDGD